MIHVRTLKEGFNENAYRWEREGEELVRRAPLLAWEIIVRLELLLMKQRDTKETIE